MSSIKPNVSNDYIIQTDDKAQFQLIDPDNMGNPAKNAIPFRMFLRGPINLRGQTADSAYKIFLGEGKI